MQAALRSDSDVDGEARFRVTSRLEVVGFLRNIAQRHLQVGVEFGEQDFIVTALLEVDPTAGRVICDYGADSAAMQRLLRAPGLRFMTQLDHVMIRFESARATAIHFADGPAFMVPLPPSIVRVQRREGYRLRIPVGRPLTCEVVPPDGSGRRTGIRVRDISVCGLSLAELPRGWDVMPGTLFRDCSIALPDPLGVLRVDLEVMHTPQPGRHQCGCRFVTPGQATAATIQRYINRVERELHART